MLLVHPCSIYQNFTLARSSQHIQTHTTPPFFVHTHTHWWFVAVTSTCGPIASARSHAVVSHRTDNGEVKGRVWARGCWGGGHSGTLANWLMSRGRGAGQGRVTRRHDIIESPWEEAGGEGEERDMPPGMASYCLLCTIHYLVFLWCILRWASLLLICRVQNRKFNRLEK